MRLSIVIGLFLCGSVISSCGYETSSQRIERIRREANEHEAQLLAKALTAAEENNAPIIIDYAGPNKPNSAGGVSFLLYFLNTSDKTIKYIHADIQAFNAVGDPQGGEIYSSSKRSVKFTGPTGPKEYAQDAWGELWYNATITCTKMLSLKITYMDGTSKFFNARQISSLMHPYQNYTDLNQRSVNSCEV